MNAVRAWKAGRGCIREFTTSSSFSANPESPSYIDVPRMIQPVHRTKKEVKGTLPVPREIFPARRRDKPSEAYINAATPKPSKERVIDPNDPHAEYNEWKYRMADVRRQNLREGLLELYERKQRTEKTASKRAIAKQVKRSRILHQPERKDETLTRQSIPEEFLKEKKLLQNGTLPDPSRMERLVQSQKSLARVSSKHVHRRQRALQSLYMNARQFITTEAQLNAEIEKVFPDGENEAWRNDHRPGENIWNMGPPFSINSIANAASSSETAKWDVSQERLKKLGEGITGGKL